MPCHQLFPPRLNTVRPHPCLLPPLSLPNEPTGHPESASICGIRGSDFQRNPTRRESSPFSPQLSCPRHQSRERQRPDPHAPPRSRLRRQTKPSSSTVFSCHSSVIRPASSTSPVFPASRNANAGSNGAKRTQIKPDSQKPAGSGSPCTWPPPSCRSLHASGGCLRPCPLPFVPVPLFFSQLCARQRPPYTPEHAHPAR